MLYICLCRAFSQNLNKNVNKFVNETCIKILEKYFLEKCMKSKCVDFG